MKLVETIKSLFAKLNEYTKAAKEIEQKIVNTLSLSSEAEEADEEEEKEVVEAPKPVAKKKAKKKPAKKKTHGLK